MAGALVPAIIIVILFYFDHNVSSQMAQRPEFNLRKPAAYKLDLALLAAMTLACGLLGLPQAPMHTSRLGTMRGLMTRSRLSVSHAAPVTACVLLRMCFGALVLPCTCMHEVERHAHEPGLAEACSAGYKITQLLRTDC